MIISQGLLEMKRDKIARNYLKGNGFIHPGGTGYSPSAIIRMSTALSHSLRYFGSHLYPTIHTSVPHPRVFVIIVFHFTPGWFWIDFLSIIQLDFLVMIFDIDVSATVLVPREGRE